MNRQDRMIAVLDQYPHAEGEPDELERYLMVERNVGGHTPSHYIATFATPEAAAHYNVEQENDEDWEAEVLVDLDTGQKFDPVTSIAWVPQ